MADLLIRDIDPILKRQIEDAARRNRRSLSDEAKLLIGRALAEGKPARKLGTELLNLVPPDYRSDDLDFEMHDPVGEPPELK